MKYINTKTKGSMLPGLAARAAVHVAEQQPCTLVSQTSGLWMTGRFQPVA